VRRRGGRGEAEREYRISGGKGNAEIIFQPFCGSTFNIVT